MKTPALAACILTVSLASGTAMAYSCEGTIEAIDEILATRTDISDDIRTQVKALRDEGEKLHDAGKHGTSISRLRQARSLLDRQ